MHGTRTRCNVFGKQFKLGRNSPIGTKSKIFRFFKRLPNPGFGSNLFSKNRSHEKLYNINRSLLKFLIFPKVKGDSPWSVTPSTFTLASAEVISIPIDLFLNDRGKFKDTLKVSVYNGKISSISLSAFGIGSSLAMTPKLTPAHEIGTLFR